MGFFPRRNTSGMNQQSAYGNYVRTHGPRGFDWRYPAIALGAPLAGAGVQALMAGGGAAGGAASASSAVTGGSTAIPAGFSYAPAAAAGGGAAGGGMTLGQFMNIANLGVGIGTSIYGQRSQNRALQQQMQLQRDQYAAQMQADAQARDEDKRRWEASQANLVRQMAAEDEERAFNRRLIEEREQRMALWRAGEDARRRRLYQYLGL